MGTGGTAAGVVVDGAPEGPVPSGLVARSDPAPSFNIMVNDSAGEARLDVDLVSVFDALANDIRLDMVTRLSDTSMTVGELGGPYDVTKPAITRHVRVLEKAGLVERRRNGKVHLLSLRADMLRHASGWLDLHWRYGGARLG